jgi:acyl-CoA synthetase (AMP-forming)/AMP-acid ligase II
MQTILDVRHRDAGAAGEVFCHFLQAGREISIRRDELWREASRYANLFRKHKIPPGEVVVIILRHSPDLLYSFLGAMLAGAIPTFMPPPSAKQDARLYWGAHERLFARMERGAVLTSLAEREEIRRNLPKMPLRAIATEEAAALSAEFSATEVGPERIAFLQHSSGTTGLKKGVALSHRAVLRQVAGYREALQLRTDDRVVSWLPLYHDMGLIACFLLPLITGNPVVMLDPFEWVVNPRSLFDAIQQFRGTLCWQPNFAFQHLCRTVRPSREIDLSSMRLWNNCSEPCRAETLQAFAQKFGGAGVRFDQLQVCYAMAETVFAVTQTAPGSSPQCCA